MSEYDRLPNIQEASGKNSEDRRKVEQEEEKFVGAMTVVPGKEQ